MLPDDSPRFALASLVFALGTLLSYTSQRLLALSGTEPPFTSLVSQEHIPYFGRIGLALVHGVASGVLVRVAMKDGASLFWLGKWTPWGVGLAVLGMALVLGIWP